MSEDVRNAILAAGLAFCILFGAISIVAIVESGPSTRGILLGGLSLAIVGMIMLGLLGAMRNPPRR
ncbi:MAG: hypothetical protein ACR2G3_03990 [Solirubrobacterales bacterium]